MTSRSTGPNATARSRSSFHLRSLAPRVYNSLHLTGDAIPRSRVSGCLMNRLLLLLLTARLVARFFCACGTNALCVRARAVPQKYQMHFLKRNIRRHPASERGRYSMLPRTDPRKRHTARSWNAAMTRGPIDFPRSCCNSPTPASSNCMKPARVPNSNIADSERW